MSILVCIDPGHGGYDPGAVSASGAREKDFTLHIGLQLRDLLQKAGFGVIMTRTTDTSPGGFTEVEADLNERCRIANTYGATVYLSIHVNAGGGHGAEIYADGDGGKIAGLVQGIINNVSTVCGVHGQAVRDGGPEGSGWRVICSTNMDAMLVEVGFIDTDDLAKIQAHLDEFAPLIARAFCTFYDVAYPEDHPAPVQSAASPAAVLIGEAAGQKCIDWLGDFYKISSPDVQKAAHWLADRYRVEIGAMSAANACPDTTFTADAALAVIKAQQAEFAGSSDPDVRAAAHWGADAMRSVKGITE